VQKNKVLENRRAAEQSYGRERETATVSPFGFFKNSFTSLAPSLSLNFND